MTTDMLRNVTPALLVCVGLAHGCHATNDDGPLGIRITHKDGVGLPADVTRLEITVAPHPSTASQCSPDANPVQGEFAIEDMTDLDDNGSPEAVLSDLPYSCPLYVQVLAYAGTELAYSGRAEGITLVEGQRRFVQMNLTPTDSLSLLSTTLTEPAFALTATALGETDGRVLVTGGFTSAEPTVCPSLYTGEQYQCFSLAATDRAYVFDHGSASLLPLAAGRMSTPRAMHTATRLGNGLVLIAGGVSSATLVVRDDSAAASWAGYEIVDIVPTSLADALDSFELFDPGDDATGLDPARDGDLTRGTFESGAEQMNAPRFGHDASLVQMEAASPDALRVLLAGGFGGTGRDTLSATTVDPFVGNATTGSYGFAAGSPTTEVPRAAPAVAFVDQAVWEFGGAVWPGDITSTNKNLAIVQKWVPNSDVTEWNVGPVIFNEFTETPRPELVRMFARAAPIGGADNAVVVTGWYGARCNDLTAGTPTPTFEYQDESEVEIPTYICPPEVAPDFTLTVDVEPPALVADTATGLTPQALSEVLALESPDHEGEVLVIGGVSDVAFTTTDAVTLFTGVDASGAIERDPAFTHTLNNARALSAAAELNGGNVLVVGGVSFDLGSEALRILDTVEYLNW